MALNENPFFFRSLYSISVFLFRILFHFVVFFSLFFLFLRCCCVCRSSFAHTAANILYYYIVIARRCDIAVEKCKWLVLQKRNGKYIFWFSNRKTIYKLTLMPSKNKKKKRKLQRDTSVYLSL